MLFLGAMVGLSLGAWAQEPQAALQAPQVPQGEATLPVLNEKPSEYIPVFQYWKENNVFQHLDLSVTAGTTGIGIEASSPIGEYLQLRAGYDFMPRFTAKMKFDITIGGKPAHQYDAQGNPVESAFDRPCGYDWQAHDEQFQAVARFLPLQDEQALALYGRFLLGTFAVCHG